jgi:hypothetical protein
MEYVTGIGIWYPTEIKTIEKKTDNLQPVNEAIGKAAGVKYGDVIR